MSGISLCLCGRDNEGNLTGIKTTVPIVSGQHAEDTLIRFHGPRGYQELGYNPKEAMIERASSK